MAHFTELTSYERDMLVTVAENEGRLIAEIKKSLWEKYPHKTTSETYNYVVISDLEDKGLVQKEEKKIERTGSYGRAVSLTGDGREMIRSLQDHYSNV